MLYHMLYQPYSTTQSTNLLYEQLVAFYEAFYERLFNVSPVSRTLFKNDMSVQGKMLVKVISSSLGVATDIEKFRGTMASLAERHFTYGVRAIDYGVVGDVLFFALADVIGQEFTSKHRTAWRRVYSKMLTVIIPTAVTLEMAAAKKKKDGGDRR
jgi:hemoglobin-like flavoprotein